MTAAALFGFGLLVSSLLTYRPSELQDAESVEQILYIDRGEWQYDLYINGVAQCGEDLEVWGSRPYSIEGVRGTDVLGWSGTGRSLQPVFDPDAFGQVTMDGPNQGTEYDPNEGTERRSQGSYCSSGSPVVWGSDNSTDRVTRSSLWREIGGEWDQYKAPDGILVSQVLQQSQGDNLLVLSVDLSRPHEVRCSTVSPDSAPQRVFDLNDSSLITSIFPDEVLIDSTLRDGQVALLIGRVSRRQLYGRLRVIHARGCSRADSEYDLVEGDGQNRLRVGSPSIALGPNSVILIGDRNALTIREYRDGHFFGRVDVDVGYDPRAGGVNEMSPTPGGDGLTIIARSLREEYDPDFDPGVTMENHLLHYVWERQDTICSAMKPELCLPGP